MSALGLSSSLFAAQSLFVASARRWRLRFMLRLLTRSSLTFQNRICRVRFVSLGLFLVLQNNVDINAKSYFSRCSKGHFLSPTADVSRVSFWVLSVWRHCAISSAASLHAISRKCWTCEEQKLYQPYSAVRESATLQAAKNDVRQLQSFWQERSLGVRGVAHTMATFLNTLIVCFTTGRTITILLQTVARLFLCTLFPSRFHFSPSVERDHDNPALTTYLSGGSFSAPQWPCHGIATG